MNRLSANALRTLVSSLLLVSSACAIAVSSRDPGAATVVEHSAAIAMPDTYSAAVAQAVLEAGGNAVDVAVAVGFALAVTYPEAGNLGGGGFMLIRMDGETEFLDYRETAPAAADRDMYLDEHGEVIADATTVGVLAAGVPGTVAGLWEAHQRYGTLPWKELVAPAIRLASDGFLPHRKLIDNIEKQRVRLDGKTNFFEHFGPVQVGTVFRQPELAVVLGRISEKERSGFYRGKTAKLTVGYVQENGGILSLEDLASYQPVWRRPLRATWREYQVVSAPLPSSGGFAVIQLLKMKDALDEAFAGLEHNSAQYIHLVAEIEKRVFADRAEYLGDPDFVDVDVEALIADDYLLRRAAEVQADQISDIAAVGPGLESPDTVHYSIVDGYGNAVANTTTLNWTFGSGSVVEGAGFLLNDEMDDFSVKPGVPNLYGVIGGVANEIQPGKRMLSSMSPTMLLEDGEVAMVLGTPGGSTIFTSVFQAIVNILDFGMTPDQAVAATRFHHQLLPADLITHSVANPLPQATIRALEERGYRAQPHDWEFGNLQVIWRDGDVLVPASDPRGRGESQFLMLLGKE